MKLTLVVGIPLLLLLIPLISCREFYCFYPDDGLQTSYFKCFRDKGNSKVMLTFTS